MLTEGRVANAGTGDVRNDGPVVSRNGRPGRQTSDRRWKIVLERRPCPIEEVGIPVSWFLEAVLIAAPADVGRRDDLNAT
jgi:hypothetical protein